MGGNDDADGVGVEAPEPAEVGGDPLRTPGLPHLGPAGVGGVVADGAQLSWNVEAGDGRSDIGLRSGRARQDEADSSEDEATFQQEASD
jgi:hypothetical protein